MNLKSIKTGIPIILGATLLLHSAEISAKKIKQKMVLPQKIEKQRQSQSRPSEPIDSITALKIIPNIHISGFDKAASSAYESFCITNNSEIPIASLIVEITYLDLKGKMLHRRDQTINYIIPQGETRSVSFKSFDTQKTLYYKLSTPPRKGGMPFNVTIKIKSISKPL